MTKDAVERYGNVKTAHPDKAMKVLQIIGSGIQSGQLQEMIDGEQLKELLQRIDTPQREVTINKV
jgi:DNA-binding TFAR19-related protein (PDSD5 family)